MVRAGVGAFSTQGLRLTHGVMLLDDPSVVDPVTWFSWCRSRCSTCCASVATSGTGRAAGSP